ncbi:MAG: acyl carrier protein [Myxococcota bacterium]
MFRDAHEPDTAVCQILAEHLGVPLEELDWTTRLDSELGLDRFDTLELLDALEEAFGMSIPDTAASLFETVFDVVQYLRQLRARAA